MTPKWYVSTSGGYFKDIISNLDCFCCNILTLTMSGLVDQYVDSESEGRGCKRPVNRYTHGVVEICMAKHTPSLAICITNVLLAILMCPLSPIEHWLTIAMSYSSFGIWLILSSQNAHSTSLRLVLICI
jgi:hypothetical protein